MTSTAPKSSYPDPMRKTRCRSPFLSIKFFVFCHGLLQLSQLLVSGYLKSSISTIERRYGLSSRTSGLLASFNEVGNTLLIVFISYFGSRVHRPRFIGAGAILVSLAGFLMSLPHFLTGPYEFDKSVARILFSVTVIGPGVAFMLGSAMLQFYVDIDKVSGAEVQLTHEDPRWVGAWWLGFLVAASLVALSAVPYFFFPREMPKEVVSRKEGDSKKKEDMLSQLRARPEHIQNLSLGEFIKRFPLVLLRNLRHPVYLLVVLAQVNISAMVAGLATFMGKFLERQFSLTASFANMIIGKSHSFWVKHNFPLLPTSAIHGCIRNSEFGHHELECNLQCSCPEQAYNPICGSNSIEYISPCSAGCRAVNIQEDTNSVLNYTDCSCISENGGFATPGTCGTGCSHLFLPFVVLSCLAGILASTSHTPSFMLILRSIQPEDKSFAVGIQFMLLRVLAWMPGPVLYGSAIDTTCILWERRCDRKAACRYYDNTLFRQRYLGLQFFFEVGAFLCFVAVYVILRRQEREASKAAEAKADPEKEKLAEKPTKTPESKV
ncbi:solute carrier organic anion transporter family member 2B1 [Pitangus sulphuratus]|nr:solute carrier organic anion transporter family member 2B1 [Pitangus sulphuratus]